MYLHLEFTYIKVWIGSRELIKSIMEKNPDVLGKTNVFIFEVTKLIS